jgi:DNA repair protein RecN (Recombination protein N)
MLALKCALAAQDRVALLVFDEIDANVGGETATRVGEKMALLGREHQVLCITHLPQVAAAAAHHFLVEKSVREGRTVSLLRPLKAKEREAEVARMLGGADTSAVQHARTLLGKAPAA